MDFSGTQLIQAPVVDVWAFLADVHKVAECAPGFEKLETLGYEHWLATVGFKVLLVDFEFILNVTRKATISPRTMVIDAWGKLPASDVKVSVNLDLVQAVDRTLLSWEAEVTVGGLLSSLPVKGVIEKKIKQFFECLEKSIQK